MSGTELVTNADAADPLRIVLVAPPYFDIPPKGYGGVEAVVAKLADVLVKCGHDVTVLASIFRAAWLGLVEAVLAGLWGWLSQVGMASRPVSLRWGGLS